MKNDIRFYESYIEWLPADIYNSIWRWQYRIRKAISRYFRIHFYSIERDFTQPYLYREE